nr:unnamed protein product [uncultured bacterium]
MKQYKRSFRFVCQGEERKIIEEMLTLQGFSWEQEDFFASSCRLVEEPLPLGSSLASFFGFELFLFFFAGIQQDFWQIHGQTCT